MTKYIKRADIIKLINDCMFDLSDSDDLTRMLTEVDELPTVTLDHLADPSKKVSISRGHENDKDVIYRQDAIEAIHREARIAGGSVAIEYADMFQEALLGALSARPEVIRCKDCKYMTKHYDTDGNAPYWTCSEWDSGTDYDGFCHYAERRTND